jgi:hypothetical protein
MAKRLYVLEEPVKPGGDCNKNEKNVVQSRKRG